MKKFIILMTVLAPISAFAQNSAAPPPAAARPASQAHILTRAELDTLLAKPEQVLIVDVRRPDELTSIGGFPVYLSIQLGDLEKSLGLIPRERNIVTVSNHAARAGRAADLLASKGFKVAGAIGAQNYEEEGGTLSKIAPPARAANEASAAH